ncbi:MAG: insulinase family protein [Oscillospiraceae bacterium]|nr:insulinase family protein [Oscillospiraceae bacterium]
MSDYPLSRTVIGEGTAFSTVPMDRFRVNLLQAHLVLPLTRETLTGNILVPMILGKSTKDYPTYQLFSKKLDRMYGATAGSSAHKIGDRLIVTLTVTAIDDAFALQGEELLKESAEVLCSMLFSPLIENGAFEEKTFRLQVQSLKDAIQAEINEKRRYALGQLNRLMFGDEPAGLARTDCLADLDSFTPEMAAAAYERILDEARIEIIHVGMGDAAPALEVFRKAFAGRIRHPAALPDTVITPGSGEVKEGMSRFDVTQSKLCFGFRSDIGPTDRRLNAMRMMNAILGGTPTSKLFLNVREKLSLCYYCSASFDRTKGALVVDSGVEHDNIEKAREAILDQVAQMQRGDFTDTDMEYARLSLYNSFRSMNESAHAVSGYYLGQLLQNTEETPELQCERIAAVTREEIIEAANALRLDTVYCLTCQEEGGADA